MKDKTMSRETPTDPPGNAPASDALIRLIYSSHSRLPGTGLGAQQDGLAEILRVARAHNAAMGVTGALVLYDDFFAQVLEGPGATVNALFAKIRSDARHDLFDFVGELLLNEALRDACPLDDFLQGDGGRIDRLDRDSSLVKLRHELTSKAWEEPDCDSQQRNREGHWNHGQAKGAL